MFRIELNQLILHSYVMDCPRSTFDGLLQNVNGILECIFNVMSKLVLGFLMLYIHIKAGLCTRGWEVEFYSLCMLWCALYG